MSTRLLLISDTHIPGRARTLPAAVIAAADDADLIIHAGDWVAASVLDELEQHAEVLGVYGNNDGADLRDRLPEVARREIERRPLRGRPRDGRCAGTARAVRMPHSAMRTSWSSATATSPGTRSRPAGFACSIPGSPTDRRRQPRCTMMTAVVDDGVLVDVRLIGI